MAKYVLAAVAGAAVLALGGAAQAPSPTDTLARTADALCRTINRCVISYAPNDGGAGKGHAVGFLAEAAQHCDASRNPKAMFNLAAWVLYSLRTTDGVSEQQSTAWIMEGGQSFDDLVTKMGLKLACASADKEAVRWGAASVLGNLTKSKPAGAPAPAASDDSVSIETLDGVTFASVGLGSQSVKMMIDTGANMMSLPATVAHRLVASGDADHGAGWRVKQADGRIIREDTIIIHQVKFGSHVVRTVVAAVAPDGASALLPITVLRQIGKFTIDFANNKLSFN